MHHKDPVYLIDGNAYIYRAYHAISPLSNKQGLPTHAAYGFINILLRVLKEKNPQYLAIAFDSKSPTFRHDVYSEYKSHRPPMPEDLVVQIPYIKTIVEAHNILTIEKKGLEADDLLATAALLLAKQGHPVIIVSGDKDLLQLVSKDITVWEPMNDRLMDEAYVQKKYNVPPKMLTDLFALMGDKADNIPGVPSVGPKTAEKLINEHGTIEGIYKNIKSVKRPKLRDNLIANKDKAILSRQLIQLKIDAPVPESLNEYSRQEADTSKLIDIYTFLNFTRLLNDQKVKKTIDKSNFTLVNSPEQLTSLATSLREAKILAIDTETTGLDTLSAELVGIALGGFDQNTYYLPIAHCTLDEEILPGQLLLSEISDALTPFLSDHALPKIGHNLKFDFAVLAHHGLHLEGPLLDTMIASYLIDPTRRSHKLDILCEEYLSITTTSFTEVTGGSKRPDSFRFVGLDEAKKYSCEDVACSQMLWDFFEPQLNSLNLWPLFSQIEIPLIPILAEMEKNGVLIDTAILANLSQEFGGKLEKLDTKITKLAGKSFNINSPQQLSEVLFEDLGLPRGRKTKTGYSTDMKVLEKLSSVHELPAIIIEHRNLSKLKSTYVDKLPTMLHKNTQRLHTSFNQTITATGRLSSSNPNLQNIPIRTEEGQRIRASFIPAQGCRFLAADYSQIDLRVLAHYSEDPALLQAFCENIDVHRQTAAEVFRVNTDFVTNEMRRVAKSINFGIVYGMSAFGLSEQLRISRKEAATFIERYFSHYQGVKTFMEDIVNKAQINGFVTTLLGRRRNLPDINSPNKNRREFAERTALNTPIQGTAADIIKMASIQVARRLKEKNYSSKVLLQIHDELILEVPEKEISYVSEIVKQSMESVLELKVPLLVNLTVSKNLAKE